MTYVEFDTIVTTDYLDPFTNWMRNGGSMEIGWWRFNRPDQGGAVTQENYEWFCNSLFQGYGYIDQAGYDDLISRWA